MTLNEMLNGIACGTDKNNVYFPCGLSIDGRKMHSPDHIIDVKQTYKGVCFVLCMSNASCLYRDTEERAIRCMSAGTMEVNAHAVLSGQFKGMVMCAFRRIEGEGKMQLSGIYGDNMRVRVRCGDKYIAFTSPKRYLPHLYKELMNAVSCKACHKAARDTAYDAYIRDFLHTKRIYLDAAFYHWYRHTNDTVTMMQLLQEPSIDATTIGLGKCDIALCDKVISLYPSAVFDLKDMVDLKKDVNLKGVPLKDTLDIRYTLLSKYAKAREECKEDAAAFYKVCRLYGFVSCGDTYKGVIARIVRRTRTEDEIRASITNLLGQEADAADICVEDAT